MRRIVYCCDVGSTLPGKDGASRFGWARASLPQQAKTFSGGVDINSLASAIEADIAADLPVAIGFEAPLCLPVPNDHKSLSRARLGEGSYAWSAPAGSAVATLAIHQTAWIFRRLVSCLRGRVTFDHSDWPTTAAGKSSVFLWEAFVAGPAHSDTHIGDAATGIAHFIAVEDDLAVADAVSADNPICLLAAAALWAGVSDSPSLFHEKPIVLKPKEPYRGQIELP